MSTLLARRRVLSLFAGAGAAALVAACSSGDDAAPGTSTTAPPGRPARDRAPSTATTGDHRDDDRGDDGATDDGRQLLADPEETAGPFPGDGSNGVNILTESGVVRSDIRASFGSSTTVAEGVPLTIELTVTDTRRRLRAARRRRRLRLALRPRRQLLDVLRRRRRRELPARRAGDRRRRAGHVHQHLPGVLLGSLAAHPLRGVPEPGRQATSADNKVATSQLALPEDVCDVGLRHRAATSRASRNLAQALAGVATTCSATTGRRSSWRR